MKNINNNTHISYITTDISSSLIIKILNVKKKKIIEIACYKIYRNSILILQNRKMKYYKIKCH